MPETKSTPATDSSNDLRTLVGDDATAEFESDPKFAERNPTASASSENLAVQRDTDDTEESDEEIEDEEEELEDEENEDDEDLDDEDDDEEDDDEEDVEDDEDEVGAAAATACGAKAETLRLAA
jgi:hypothetical protein